MEPAEDTDFFVVDFVVYNASLNVRAEVTTIYSE